MDEEEDFGIRRHDRKSSSSSSRRSRRRQQTQPETFQLRPQSRPRQPQPPRQRSIPQSVTQPRRTVTTTSPDEEDFGIRHHDRASSSSRRRGRQQEPVSYLGGPPSRSTRFTPPTTRATS